MSIRKREHAHEARCHLPVLLPLGEGSWLAFARCKTPYEDYNHVGMRMHAHHELPHPQICEFARPGHQINGRPSVLGETQLLCLDSEPNTSFGPGTIRTKPLAGKSN